MQQNPDFQPGRQARARPRELAAEAAAAAAQASPPRAGLSRSAQSRPQQGRGARLRDVRVQESIFISEGDDDEDVGVNDEPAH